MGENKITRFKEFISLKDLVTIFKRKKWLFIGFFFVTLIIGLLITFLKTPLYQSESTLKFGDVYFEDNLYKYYPEEAKDLDIYAPGLDIDEVVGNILGNASSTIRSDKLLDEVFNKIDGDIERDELRQSLRTLTDKGNRVIKLIVTYPDAEKSFLINQTFINIYLSNHIESRSVIIEDIIKEIEEEIIDLEQEIETIDDKTDLASMEAIIIDLDKIKYNLENNREIYVNNVEITEEPSVPTGPINADYLENIIIVIFASLVAGLIAVYIPNIFTSLKD